MKGEEPKIIHMAKYIREDGAVSPLCAVEPKALDLSKATWTNRKEAVTCQKCKKKGASDEQVQK